MRVTCAKCGKHGNVPDAYAGKTVRCKCGGSIQVPDDEILHLDLQEPSPVETYAEPPRYTYEMPKKSRRGWLFAALGSAVAVPAMCCGGCVVLTGGGKSSNNAKCVLCSHEFRIPELSSMATNRTFTCPECGNTTTAFILYKDRPAK